MATVIADGLLVCVDCAMMCANGELGQGDAAAEAAHAAQMVAQWGEHTAGLVLACEPDEEGCDTYSTRRCDGCGSGLAGARCAAAVLAS